MSHYTVTKTIRKRRERGAGNATLVFRKTNFFVFHVLAVKIDALARVGQKQSKSTPQVLDVKHYRMVYPL